MSDKPAVAEPTGNPLCFVICPIGEPDSDVRKKSDKMMKHLIGKVLAPQYEILRADKIGLPGMITVQIVQALVDAELVIADLTDGNQNVYYELAIRHAAKKPAVHIISAGQNASFDVQGMRFVSYDLTDPDVLEQAQKELRRQVDAIRRTEEVTTPVQIAAILRDLHSGEDRDAQISALFESLNAGISSLQRDVAEIVRDVRRRDPWGGGPLWGSGAIRDMRGVDFATMQENRGANLARHVRDQAAALGSETHDSEKPQTRRTHFPRPKST